MKQFFTSLCFILLFTINSFSQINFSDNFDSYTPGVYLGVANTKWSTWGNKPGSDEDVIISSERSLSPNNAIKIETSNPAGGPMDVILPFGAKYTTGVFKYKMSMFVPEGKTAYFNFQGNVVVGQVWAVNAIFSQTGDLQITNASNVPLLTEKFPVEQWFDIEFDINLSSNLWKLSIDNKCVGAFGNTTNSIASIDLFPTSDICEFFVDDVSFSHDPTATALPLDGGISEITWTKGKLTGTVDKPLFSLRNHGSTTITSAEIVVSRPGLPDTTVVLSNISILKNTKKNYNLPNVTLRTGVNEAKARLSKVNGQALDGEECNNFASFIFTAVQPAVHKAVLVEEATGTWCPWCPRGAVFMDGLSTLYKGLFIPIAMHGGSATEPMRLAEYETFLDFGGFPTVRVNRITNADTDINPALAESPFLDEIAKAPEAKIVAGAKYNATTKKLDVSADVEFLEDVDGDFYVSLVLTEDDIKGTTAAYNQANNYAGGTNGPMGGYENLPNPVPAAQMTYDHVARAVSGLESTPENTISGPFVKGDKVTYNFVTTLAATWKSDKINIIPILLKNSNEYVNATSATIAVAVANGFTSGTKEIEFIADVNIAPNPARTYANVTFVLNAPSDVKVEMYNLAGTLISVKDAGYNTDIVEVRLDTQNLSTGMYMVKVVTSSGNKYQKLIIE